jgi:argininosuccinate synthase
MPAEGAKGTVKKVVLAYSGGLDTSIILKWLQETYGCEVVTFTADLGQGEELEPARRKALMLGIKPENIFIQDLREEFVRDYVFPMFRANALYEGVYLLGTSIARPLIAKAQIEIARATGADAVCHGATGKGNDQVRFELTYYALEPSIRIVAPWREWSFKSREQLIEFAEKHQIPVAKDKRRRSRSMPTCCTPPPRGRCWRTRPRSPRPTSTSARCRRWRRPTRPRRSPSASSRAMP